MNAILAGSIEIDETYIGGEQRGKGQSTRGPGTKKKPVLVLVQWDESSHTMPIEKVDRTPRHAHTMKHVAQNATVFTDELETCGGLRSHFEGEHRTVNHSKVSTPG